jgi:hypothetical protein
MSDALHIAGSVLGVYFVGLILSIVIMLALGSSAKGRFPEEVFGMGLLWPVCVPLWIGEYLWVKIYD